MSHLLVVSEPQESLVEHRDGLKAEERRHAGDEHPRLFDHMSDALGEGLSLRIAIFRRPA